MINDDIVNIQSKCRIRIPNPTFSQCANFYPDLTFFGTILTHVTFLLIINERCCYEFQK